MRSWISAFELSRKVRLSRVACLGGSDMVFTRRVRRCPILDQCHSIPAFFIERRMGYVVIGSKDLDTANFDTKSQQPHYSPHQQSSLESNPSANQFRHSIAWRGAFPYSCLSYRKCCSDEVQISDERLAGQATTETPDPH